MSLNISLSRKMKVEMFSANITHNLADMATAVGVYSFLWYPEKSGIKKAAQLIKPIEKAVDLLEKHPDEFKKYEAKNGWGTYDDFLIWLKEVRDACEIYPDAEVESDR
jgi:hypothetical protein